MIFYGGDANLDRDRTYKLSFTNSGENTYTVDWNVLQNDLEIAATDVLILMDCIYLGRTQGQCNLGATKILAASTTKPPTVETEITTFAEALLQGLEHFRGKCFGISQLREYMISLPNMGDQPEHIVLGGGDTPRITLFSPPDVEPQSDARESKVAIELSLSSSGYEQQHSIDNWVKTSISPHAQQMTLAHPTKNRLEYSFSLPRNEVTDSKHWKKVGSGVPDSVIDVVARVMPSLVKPRETAQPPTTTIQDLVDSLNMNQGIREGFPTRNGQYDSVTVLPIMWKNSDYKEELREELAALMNCFQEQFSFDVEDIYEIAGESKAHRILRSKIEYFSREHDKPRELVIVVYAGHGENTRDEWARQEKTYGQSIWAESASPKNTNRVNWSAIQPFLVDAECDVAIILNCCYAGNAAPLGMNEGVNEILAACGRREETYTGRQLFLRALREVLESYEGRSIALNQVHRELLRASGKDKVGSDPFHDFIDAEESTQSIELRPIDRYDSISDHLTLNQLAGPSKASLFCEIILNRPEKIYPNDWIRFWKNQRFPNHVEKIHFHTLNGLSKTGFAQT
ncbi:hypothetical protein N7520_002370 [Penicillium odoratum]|uniref:uncharacterized protein n=1 Tax=Penicillium odoratum TaxID=1167516 RepID=UPI0025465DF8|nr:uncharacterized protein N7520_002370 [Penicillium odoratum]KAJ5771841.1 hypothetical protein N7520_002370 [Penicillium odoratum]